MEIKVETQSDCTDEYAFEISENRAVVIAVLIAK